MTCRTPEGAIEDGIYNRLTHRTNGITTEAQEGYCHPESGVQKWFGQVELTPESMSQWARAGLAEGPVVLIVAGSDVTYDTDYRKTAIGEYAISLYIASANYRSSYEASGGDDGDNVRKPGIFKVKQDILDRLLDHGIVKAEYNVDGSDVESWEDPAWVDSGRLITLTENVVLYELVLRIRVSRIHGLVAYSELDDAAGVDVTLTKEPSTAGDEFQVGVEADL